MVSPTLAQRGRVRQRVGADEVAEGRLRLRGSCPRAWCKSVEIQTVSDGLSRDVQIASGGSLIVTLSFTGTMDSGVMQRAF